MDALLARYLDGELTANEARALLQRLQEDPGLASELHDYERILASANQLKYAEAPLGFADAVMDRIASQPTRFPAQQPSRASSQKLSGPGTRGVSFSWRQGLAVAAVLVLAFVLGRLTVPGSNERIYAPTSPTRTAQLPARQNLAQQPRAEVASLVNAGTSSSAENFRVVHLIYSPQGDEVQSVTVAGSFNGWNAHGLPMQKNGAVWTMNLVLPPGAYEYMFVEDGKRWVTDPLAPFTRDDGFGNRNAVLELGA